VRLTLAITVSNKWCDEGATLFAVHVDGFVSSIICVRYRFSGGMVLIAAENSA
jgi:hypothetical protein